MSRELVETANDMSVRTWLAGQALAGLASSDRIEGLSTEDIGKAAAEFADATLKALNSWEDS